MWKSGIDGLSSPIDDVQANIQSKVGDFLGAKKKLLQMVNSSLLTVKEEAQKLYNVQLELEKQLSNVTTIIEKVKQDVYGLSDITAAASFYYMMTNHIDNVDTLYQEYLAGGGSSVGSGISGYVEKYWKWGLAAIGAWILIKRR